MRFRAVLLLLPLILLSVRTALAEQITGELVLSVIDYADATSDTSYELRLDSGVMLPLRLTSTLRQVLGKRALATGDRVVLDGDWNNNQRTSESEFVVEALSFAPGSSTLGMQRSTYRSVTGQRTIALILVNLSDASVPCSAAAIDGTMFTDSQSARATYEASSRSQITFSRDTNGDSSADIFGPYTIAASKNTCAPTTWASLGSTAAQSAGVNLALYQHIVYVLPQWNELACGWSGLGNLGCGSNCTAWIANCGDANTYTHELGHNIGMNHASLATAAGTITSEYGDWSCPMGNGSYSVIFNGPHQDEMGWFDALSGKSVQITDVGTYAIAPLESDSSASANPYILKLPITGGDYYYFSYRTQSSTFNEVPSTYANKVNVHRFTTGDNTRLVQRLDVGQSFTDAVLNLSFSVASANSSGASLTIASLSGDGDNDDDGYSDLLETSDGTSSVDSGSFLPRLSSPLYSLWNSFLGMVNVLELVNPSTSASTTATVTFYSISGDVLDSRAVAITPGQQVDLIVNDFVGYTADSYGLIRVEYSGELDGRMSFYRSNADGQSYAFAYSIPFAASLGGTTGVGFNTFQPSTNPSDAGYVVYNWLTLVNLSSVQKDYTVYTYDQTGALRETRAVSVLPFGRFDIDGGHAMLGPSVVGYHEIVPADSSAPYIAQLIRYGSNANAGESPTTYLFAFPLSAQVANGQYQYVPTSRMYNDTTWVELTNSRGEAVTVSVDFYNESGSVTTMSYALAPHSQLHVEADSTVLADGTRGYVAIRPSVANSIISEAMFYHRSTATGSIMAMYGVPAREALRSSFSGSYNLYLGQVNRLALSNVSDTAFSASVAIRSADGLSTNSSSVLLYPRETTEVAIDTTVMPVDTYGSVTVTTTDSRVIIPDLFRFRYEADSTIDFAFPTVVRPQ